MKKFTKLAAALLVGGFAVANANAIDFYDFSFSGGEDGYYTATYLGPDKEYFTVSGTDFSIKGTIEAYVNDAAGDLETVVPIDNFEFFKVNDVDKRGQFAFFLNDLGLVEGEEYTLVLPPKYLWLIDLREILNGFDAYIYYPDEIAFTFTYGEIIADDVVPEPEPEPVGGATVVGTPVAGEYELVLVTWDYKTLEFGPNSMDDIIINGGDYNDYAASVWINDDETAIRFMLDLIPGDYTIELPEGVVYVEGAPNAAETLTFTVEGEVVETEYYVVGAFTDGTLTAKNQLDPDDERDGVYGFYKAGIPAGEMTFYIATNEDTYYRPDYTDDNYEVIFNNLDVFEGVVVKSFSSEGSSWTVSGWLGGDISIQFNPEELTIVIEGYNLVTDEPGPEPEPDVLVDYDEATDLSNGVVRFEYADVTELWFDLPSNAYGYVLDEDGEETIATLGFQAISIDVVEATADAPGYATITVDLSDVDLEVGDYYIYIPEEAFTIIYNDNYDEFFYNYEIMYYITLDQPTGVNSINAIDGDTVIYNMNGVRVDSNKLTKGIYIVNGRKMVIK